jgi:hypothetical protein
VNKLLSVLVPSEVKLSTEVRDMLANCCTGAPIECLSYDFEGKL